MLGEQTPNEADPDGDWYAFEKGAARLEGGDGYADVWRRGPSAGITMDRDALGWSPWARRTWSASNGTRRRWWRRWRPRNVVDAHVLDPDAAGALDLVLQRPWRPGIPSAAKRFVTSSLAGSPSQ